MRNLSLSASGLAFRLGGIPVRVLPSFLITLGMLFAVNGMTLYLTQVTAIGVEPDLQIQSVFNGFLFGAPTIALWALAAWLLSVSAEYQAALARPHIVGGWTQ